MDVNRIGQEVGRILNSKEMLPNSYKATGEALQERAEEIERERRERDHYDEQARTWQGRKLWELVSKILGIHLDTEPTGRDLHIKLDPIPLLFTSALEGSGGWMHLRLITDLYQENTYHLGYVVPCSNKCGGEAEYQCDTTTDFVRAVREWDQICDHCNRRIHNITYKGE